MKMNSFLNKLFKSGEFFVYLFFLFLPFQIDALLKANYLNFSGFYNPYLSHFIYISDVCLIIALCFFSFFFLLGGEREVFIKKSGFLWGLLLFLFFYAVSLFFAFDSFNSFIYLLRILEFFILFLLISNRFIKIKYLIAALLFSLFISSVIGVVQYFDQESIGLFFLKESNIANDIPGVSKFDIGKEKIVRAYGTFLHPNIIAGYLVFAILLITSFLHKHKNFYIRVFFAFIILVFLFTLLFTFSRTAFISLIIGFFVYFMFSVKKVPWKWILTIGFFVVLGFVVLDFFSLLSERLLFTDKNTISERMQFVLIAKSMIFDNFFGVGVGNFTAVMQSYTDAKLVPWLFQPVHNIFLLVFAEIGWFGGFIFFVFFFCLPFFIKNKQNRAILLSLWTVFLIIGMFDHYLISLYQGQALFWLFIAMFGFDCFTRKPLAL